MKTHRTNSPFDYSKSIPFSFLLPVLLCLILIPIEISAQSGFSSGHGNGGAVSATVGLPFYRQKDGQLSISEGVEQGYLLYASITEDCCEQQAYSNFDFEWGDTLAPGTYFSRKYLFLSRNHYDSLVTLTLYVHPVFRVADTLLVMAGDSLSDFPGAHRDTLASRFGCDSIVERLVIVVNCPADVILTADYGEESIPVGISAPQILPLIPSVRIVSDYVGYIPVGTDSAVSWQIIANNDTLSCIQNVRVDYPPCGGDFVAIDGNGYLYETVRVGANCWMKQNLRATLYTDGDTIPIARVLMVNGDTLPNWQGLGLLYSWYSAVHIPEGSHEAVTVNADGEVQGACPSGWHLPSAAEMALLLELPASTLRAIGDIWLAASDNASGFSALPAGSFDSEMESFENYRVMASYWTAEETSSGTASIGEISVMCAETGVDCSSKFDGNAIRCLKD